MTTPQSASLSPARKPLKSWDRTPEEEARYQAMLGKCRKWSQPTIESKAEVMPTEPAIRLPDPVGVASTENTPAAELIWTRTGSHEMTSGCTRYKVRKEAIEHLMTRKGASESTHAWRYQCWVRVQWLWYVEFGPLQDTFAAAQALCEHHCAGVPLRGEAALSALSQPLHAEPKIGGSSR